MLSFSTDYGCQLRRLQCNEHWAGKVDLNATVIVLLNFIFLQTQRLPGYGQLGNVVSVCVCSH